MSPVTHFPRQRADSTPLLPSPALPLSPNSGLLFPTYLLPPLPFRWLKRTPNQTLSHISYECWKTGPFKPDTSYFDFTGGVTPEEEIGDNRAVKLKPRVESSLKGSVSLLKCSTCSADLCFTDQIVSKGFNGRHGRAYLISPVLPSYLPPSAISGFSPFRRWTSPSAKPIPSFPEDPVAMHRMGGYALPNTFLHKPAQRRLITGEHTVADLACKICGRTLGWKYVAASEEGQRYKVGKFIVEMGRVCKVDGWDGEGLVDEGLDVDESFCGDEGGLGRYERQSFKIADGKAEVREVTDGEWEVGLVGRPFLLGSPSGPASPREMRRVHREDRRLVTPRTTITEEEVEFNSADEDECDDLFAGVWSKGLAMRRRKLRILRSVEGRA